MNKQDLLKAAEYRTLEITVSGVKTIVRELSADVYQKYREEKPPKDAAIVIAWAVVNEDGQPVYTPKEADELSQNMRVSHKIVQSVLDLTLAEAKKEGVEAKKE